MRAIEVFSYLSFSLTNTHHTLKYTCMYKQMYSTTRANVLSVEDDSVQPERRRCISRFRCRISNAVWSSLLLREACQIGGERRRAIEGMVRYITFANGKGWLRRDREGGYE
jgi:hypothetical protein